MSLERWSADRRFGVRLEDDVLETLRDECARSGHLETGGVLLGRYSSRQDCAVVTEVVPEPPDSSRGRTWFHRGVRGLRALFVARWRARRDVYLGEWHFHPGVNPEPSGRDQEQIRVLAAAASVGCAAPVLLVAGLMPNLVIDAWVAPRRAPVVHLSER